MRVENDGGGRAGWWGLPGFTSISRGEERGGVARTPR